MRRGLLLVALVVASLVVAAPGFGRPETTNSPAIFTVKVKLTDHAIVMSPVNHAARGSTVTFILTNRGRKTHTFSLGQAKPGYSQGFVRTLKPNQQLTLVMYLNIRAVLKTVNRTNGVPVATGAFRIT